MLTVACVRTGTKYGLEYVERLRDGVARHLGGHRFVCLTDQVVVPDGVVKVDVSHLGLPGWWAKMALFSPSIRGAGKCVYLDLDSVIVGDLDPMAGWNGKFAICESFTRRAGVSGWPCRYGSCAMVFANGWGRDVWDAFWRDRRGFIQESKYGDQQAIERLVPDAALLQDVLPAGFFLNKRDLPKHLHEAPKEASIVVFGGPSKPHNCSTAWVQREWLR